jgi:hypothetical protein
MILAGFVSLGLSRFEDVTCGENYFRLPPRVAVGA